MPLIVSELDEDSKTPTSITTTITVRDDISGLGEIVWYYKKETDASWKSVTDTYQTLHSVESGTTTTVEKTHTFNDLDPYTNYQFYAIIFDVAGNEVGSKSAAEALVIKTNPVLVTSVTLDKSKETIEESETITLKATIKPDNTTFRNVNWTCSDPTIAKLSATTSVSGTNIEVTGLRQGTVTITATSVDGTNYSASCTITVLENYVNYPIDLGIVSAGNALVHGGQPLTDWKLFYKDDKYTYIIASDYIPTSKFPDGVFTANNGKYSGWWSSIPSETTPTWKYKDIFLFDGLRNVNSSERQYKEASYLLNTSSWTSMVNSTYADAAIGGPTLEMQNILRKNYSFD